ncbi:uncharacterized protein MYCFIDRAFT_177886 [Pseudocercospora fijiensis CIRAD86]|uniref:Uncharacterized protein n=1 Tax=Pseudocercospora fijiensis (strain CIRAD86) TaxID=383855 RepID=M2YNI4_PSEFD|nr:uncharacterized protein MYCFIDRAFT_177886 [Pseudocercospora fijiensis CIRAD86]EME79255.1 hypothetical protein MYCFIDRAFT_177886 [Pseudocercospora fijiensis CIRAD86]
MVQREDLLASLRPLVCFCRCTPASIDFPGVLLSHPRFSATSLIVPSAAELEANNARSRVTPQNRRWEDLRGLLRCFPHGSLYQYRFEQKSEPDGQSIMPAASGVKAVSRVHYLDGRFRASRTWFYGVDDCASSNQEMGEENQNVSKTTAGEELRVVGTCHSASGWLMGTAVRLFVLCKASHHRHGGSFRANHISVATLASRTYCGSYMYFRVVRGVGDSKYNFPRQLIVPRGPRASGGSVRANHIPVALATVKLAMLSRRLKSREKSLMQLAPTRRPRCLTSTPECCHLTIDALLVGNEIRKITVHRADGGTLQTMETTADVTPCNGRLAIINHMLSVCPSAFTTESQPLLSAHKTSPRPLEENSSNHEYESAVQLNIRHNAATKSAPWKTITIGELDNLKSTIQAHLDTCSTSPTRTLQLQDEILGPGPETLEGLVSIIEQKSVLVGGPVNSLDVIVYDHDPMPAPLPDPQGRRKEKNSCAFETHTELLTISSRLHLMLLGR